MAPIPSMSPEESFRRDVLPNFDCYMSDFGAEWKAKNVAYAAAHLIEWVYEYYRVHGASRLSGASSLSDFRQGLFVQCPALKVVHDMAEAHKHRFLTRRRSAPTITSSTEAFQAHDEWLEVTATGQRFDDVISEVVDFWRRWLGVPEP